MSENLDFDEMADLINRGATQASNISVAIAPIIAEILGLKVPYVLNTEQWSLSECPNDGWYKLEMYIKVKEG